MKEKAPSSWRIATPVRKKGGDHSIGIVHAVWIIATR
jgi:hypothetical protein